MGGLGERRSGASRDRCRTGAGPLSRARRARGSVPGEAVRHRRRTWKARRDRGAAANPCRRTAASQVSLSAAPRGPAARAARRRPAASGPAGATRRRSASRRSAARSWPPARASCRRWPRPPRRRRSSGALRQPRPREVDHAEPPPRRSAGRSGAGVPPSRTGSR